MKMPFGKYKGWELSKVPEDYLMWVLEECNIKEALATAIEIQLGLRVVETVDNDVVSRWYRQMASEFHPDKRGGTHLGMLAVNRGRELLLELMNNAPR